MIQGIFGQGSVYATLRQGLGESMDIHRGVADRIANATNGDPTGQFDGDLQAGAGEALDLETEMVRLADTAFRYDTETRLLREAYTRLRTAMNRRG